MSARVAPAGAALAAALALLLGAVAPAAAQNLRGFNVPVRDLLECGPSRRSSRTGAPCATLADARAAGATVVRLNFALLPLVERAAPHALPAGSRETLRELVAEAAGLGLRVVIDPHGMPGAARHTTLERDDVFYRRDAAGRRARAALVRLWTELAREFRGDDTVLAFDLVNEPYDPPPDAPLNALYRRLVRAVAAEDPERDVILDFHHTHYWLGPGDGADGHRPREPGWYAPPGGADRVRYSTHVYWPLDYTHQGIAIRRADGSVVERGAGRRWEDPDSTTNGRPWTLDGLSRRLAGVIGFAEEHGHERMFVGEFSASACEGCGWEADGGWEEPAGGGALWLTHATALFDRHGWDWAYHSLNGASYWSASLPPRRWGHLEYLFAR